MSSSPSVLRRSSIKERWRRASISFGFKSPQKDDNALDKNQVKALLGALNEENEEKAIAIYFAVDTTGRSLELDMHPSLPIGYDENSPLHLAGAAHAANLLKIFIDHGGSPNTTNASNQTCLHASCGGIEKENKVFRLGSIVKEAMGIWDQVAGRNQESGDNVGQKKAMQLECLELLLNWQGLEIDGISEKPLVNAVDEQGNTALHYAAERGLNSCCKALIKHGAILTLVNGGQETACELAGGSGHEELADALEALVLFNESLEDATGQHVNDTREREVEFKTLTTSQVLALADHRSAVVAESLRVSPKWALHLLSACNWNAKQLSEKTKEEIVSVLSSLGISEEIWEKAVETHVLSSSLPSSVSTWLEVGAPVLVNISGADDGGDFMPAIVLEISESSACVQMKGEGEEDWEIDVGFENLKRSLKTGDCQVCGETLPLLINECGHAFCGECWAGYLTVQLREGNGLVPTCAAPKCCLEVSSALAMEAFADDIESNKELRQRWERVWCGNVVSKGFDLCACPGPACEDIVLRETSQEYTSNAHCEQGHSFCWDCKSLNAHSPTPCDVWEEWNALVRLHLEAVMEGGELSEDSSAQDVGNVLWLAANTKKCPKCATRTEKSDGCNHMTCKQCRHDYCWICCKEWSLHSNKTGGYYRCNRFEEEANVSTDNRGEGSASEDHKRRAAEAVKAERFIHFYTRFAAQESSSKMEQAKQKDSLSKIKLLQRRFKDSNARQRDSETRDNEHRKSSDGSGGGVEVSISDEVWSLTSDLNFVGEDIDNVLSLSFAELARCRLVLRNSYAFTHVKLSTAEFDKQSRVETRRDRRRSLYSNLRYSSLRCEAAQSELETITETLSEILARRYMRASCRQIRSVTIAAEGYRQDLLRVFSDHLKVGVVSSAPRSWPRQSFQSEGADRHARDNADNQWEEQGVLSALLWGNEDLKEQQLLSRVIMDSLQPNRDEEPRRSVRAPEPMSTHFSDQRNHALRDWVQEQRPSSNPMSAIDMEAPREYWGNGWSDQELPGGRREQRHSQHQVPFSPSFARPPVPPLYNNQFSVPNRSYTSPIRNGRGSGGDGGMEQLDQNPSPQGRHRMAVVPLRHSPQVNDPNSGIWICRHCKWANSPWEGRCSSCREVPEAT